MAELDVVSEAGQLIYQNEPVADIDCTIVVYDPPYIWAGDFMFKGSFPAHLPNLLMHEPLSFSIGLSSVSGRIKINTIKIVSIEGGLGHEVNFQGLSQLTR